MRYTVSLVGIVVIVLISCNSRKFKGSNAVSSELLSMPSISVPINEERAEPIEQDTEEVSCELAIKNRVSSIFNDVYLGKVKGYNENWEKKYFTHDFYDVYTMILEHDAKYHQGEIGFLDYDIWTKGQDYADDISAIVSTISVRNDFNDNEFADVVVNINNGSSKQQLNLTLLKVDKEWYIDSMDGLKSSMKSYLATDN